MAISNSGILGLKYFAGVSLKDKTPGLDDDDDELLVVNVCALFTWDTPGWTLGYETGCCTVRLHQQKTINCTTTAKLMCKRQGQKCTCIRVTTMMLANSVSSKWNCNSCHETSVTSVLTLDHHVAQNERSHHTKKDVPTGKGLFP